VVLERIAPLLREVEGVRRNEDPECLHRMRVASRRLRSALLLLDGCVPPETLRLWRRAVRRLTRILGEARDLDVQILFLKELLGKTGKDVALSDEGGVASDATAKSRKDAKVPLPYEALPGVERLRLRLQTRREKRQRNVLRALDRLEEEGLLQRMGAVLREMLVRMELGEVDRGPSLRESAFRLLSLRLEEVLSFAYVVDNPADEEGHHALRVAAKRLRYSLELFTPLLGEAGGALVKEIKVLQDRLGELHDCDVWRSFLPAFIDAERRRTLRYYGHGKAFPRLEKGLRFLLHRWEEERERRFASFLAWWRDAEKRNFWRRCREEIASLLSDGGKTEVVTE
jgi:CHAD domain-containing protein